MKIFNVIQIYGIFPRVLSNLGVMLSEVSWVGVIYFQRPISSAVNFNLSIYILAYHSHFDKHIIYNFETRIFRYRRVLADLIPLDSSTIIQSSLDLNSVARNFETSAKSLINLF